MNILVISAQYPTAIQTWFINYLKAMEPRADRMDVLSLSPGVAKPHPDISKLKPHRVWVARTQLIHQLTASLFYFIRHIHKAPTWHYLRNVFSLHKSFKERILSFRYLNLLSIANYSFDIIHCHSEKAAYFLLPLLKTLNTPIVITYHGLPPDDVPDLRRDQRDQLYANVQGIVTNTEFSKNQLLSIADVKIPIKVIRQGIEVKAFPYREPRSLSTKAPLKLLTVGRFDKYKGHTFVFQAMEYLIQKGISPEYRIVGAGSNREALVSEAKQRGLQDHVKIVEPSFGEALVKEYHNADIFILPSYQENFDTWAETQGIVVQESQACGTIVLASKSGGVPECIEDGKTALLFQPKDSKEMASALIELTLNPALHKNMVHAAKSKVLREYSIAEMARKITEYYETL